MRAVARRCKFYGTRSGHGELGIECVRTPNWGGSTFKAFAYLILLGNLPHFTSGGSVHLVVE